MCGIAGVMHRDGSPIDDWSTLARTLTSALAHRGPDGAGVWRSPSSETLLVHRRLAIIDLSPDGAQPMTSADGRHVLVFNGEVYNHRELRSALEARGERFRTSSDTDVLLRLLALDGPPALARVRGMFALACWDTVDRSLVLARDRFGIKPLYVAARGASIAFASELSALARAGLVDVQPSPSAVLGFLAWGSVPPPLAWNRGAEMLEAGTWREWRQDGTEVRGRFADARDVYQSARRDPSRQDAGALRAAVGDAVRDSVRAHLVADVPVGVFLSGGIDSGALVSAATSVGATGLKTFTVAFDDASSEAGRARTVGQAFGTEHHELRVDASQIVADLPQVLARLDQPTIDGVNSFYVSRAVATTGIKAVLSGAGGDEVFGGYPSFSRLPRAMRAKRVAGPLWPIIGAAGRGVVPSHLRARWTHFARSNGSWIEAYRVQRGFFLPQELRELAGPALRDPAVWSDACAALEGAERACLEAAGDERSRAAVARMESRMYLQSQLLRDLDVMSMAHGLEVRVPFVDAPLVGAVWPALASHPALVTGKRLLHATLERPLPDAIVRHPKQGFTLPFATWMHGELAPLVRDGLDRAARAGWIASDAPSRLWSDFAEGRVHWSRAWGVSILGHFLHAA
jgi:asparagine synthase (glutamine-hydrolysing)